MQRIDNACKYRWLRVPIGLLILITCLRVWAGPTPILQEAWGQLPDSAAQRKRLLEETRRTNQLLEEIKKLLKDHTFNVRIQGADNQAPAPAVPHSER